MYPTGTKFKKFGMEWEIISTNKGLYYTCICRDKKVHVFRDFNVSELEGVEFY
jgi:hypothetical protein